MLEGIKCLPCHFSGAKFPFISNYETIVFHTTEWKNKVNDDEYKLLKSLCESSRKQIVDFRTYAKAPLGNKMVQLIFQRLYVWHDRHIWPMVVKLYQKYVRR